MLAPFIFKSKMLWVLRTSGMLARSFFTFRFGIISNEVFYFQLGLCNAFVIVADLARLRFVPFPSVFKTQTDWFSSLRCFVYKF